MRVILLSLAVAVGVSPVASLSAFADDAAISGPIVSSAARHVLSPPLRDMPPTPPSGTHQERDEGPLRIPFPPGTRHKPDAALQTEAPTQVKTIDVIKFPGLGLGQYGFNPPTDRSDSNGAVGATQYVQAVNASFAVFDKITGAFQLAVAGTTLWSRLGGDCAYFTGDPIALYDRLAGRWVLTAIGVTSGNLPDFDICVAISQTSDATGAYYLYEFKYGRVLPDYQKVGVWPDAYYASYNTAGYHGRAMLCAFDRRSMLAGLSASEQCFSSRDAGILPSDMDGTMPPPVGSPNYMIYFGAHSLNELQFHVDWDNPKNSSIYGPLNIPVPAFTPTCGGAGAICVPQRGGQKLNAMGDRLMYRLAYRNFGDHESLVVNHTVVAGPVYGVRWYELRTPRTPTLYQTGTYAPGGTLYRWMGSIAMDRMGDIAVGYSASDGAEYPSIRYAGRTPDTRLGMLLGEKIVKTSVLPHLSPSWGDYSGIAVDPADDCTFYYTNQYSTSATGLWNTEVNAFRFSNCK